MRLSGIDTLAAGNAFLPVFMAKYNARFAKALSTTVTFTVLWPVMTISTTPLPGRKNARSR